MLQVVKRLRPTLPVPFFAEPTRSPAGAGGSDTARRATRPSTLVRRRPQRTSSRSGGRRCVVVRDHGRRGRARFMGLSYATDSRVHRSRAARRSGLGAGHGLGQLWQANTDSDPVTRCGLADSLADVQDGPAGELEWDVRALRSACIATDAHAAGLGMSQGVAGLLPSLHLNLADVYRRLGLLTLRRATLPRRVLHSARSRRTGIFDSIGQAIARVLERLQAETPTTLQIRRSSDPTRRTRRAPRTE